MRKRGKALLAGSCLSVILLGSQAVGAARAGVDFDIPRPAAASYGDPQQPDEPVMSPAERAQLAFPGFLAGGETTGPFPGRLMSNGFADWPAMRYIGDSAEIADKTFTVSEVRLVVGSERPMAYEPARGRKRFAPEGLRTNLLDFSQNTEVFIPPNSTLVLVRVEVEPEAVERPPGEAGCETPGERDYGNSLRVSYQGLGEVNVLRTSSDENFGQFDSPTMYCLSRGWVYFHIGSLAIDESQLWFEIVDAEFDRDVALWTLTSAP